MECRALEYDYRFLYTYQYSDGTFLSKFNIKIDWADNEYWKL